jgi:hypothetical protein
MNGKSVVFVLLLAGASLQAGGCGYAAPGSDVADSDGGFATARVSSSSTSCTATDGSGAANEAIVRLSTTLDGYMLSATSEFDPGTSTSTTTYAIRRGATLVLTKTRRATPATTTTEVELGAAFEGARRVSFREDGTTLRGSVDGRAIVPVDVAHPRVEGGIEFADGGSVPNVKVDDPTRAAIHGLIDRVTADAPATCLGGVPQLTGADVRTRAVDALVTALGRSNVQANAPVPPIAPGGIKVDDLTVSFAPEGVPPVSASSVQNNPIQFETPNCQTCQNNCITNVIIELIPEGSQLCSLGCLIPFVGACAQKLCSDLGTCDNNETCCGNLCCGPGTACGNSALGTCCPNDHPVGCGNSTGVTCFKAGSTCCGNLDVACPSGQVCGNVSTTATCCTKGNLSTSGQCCQNSPCGGQCCDSGTCLNNTTCCFGPVASGNTCCGITDSVCNGSCCAGSCTSSGACCSTVVCGSACCGADQVCLDPGSSSCGPPTTPLLILENSAGTVLHVSEAIAGTAYSIVGEAFVAGTVTVTLTTPGGTTTTLGTATANSAGKFTLSHTFQPLETGADQIVATEGTLQASLAVAVVELQ